MNESLRKRVKLLKALQGITYREIASYLEMNESSFNNWLNGLYNLGIDRQLLLDSILTNLSE